MRNTSPTAAGGPPLARAIRYGDAGWVHVRDDPAGVDALYLRFDAQGRIVEMYIDGEGNEITPAQVRRLHLLRYRAKALSRPDLLNMMLQGPDPEIRTRLEEGFPDSRGRLTPELHEPDPITELRPPGPDGLTDAFFRELASAYTSAVARGERPNKTLAEQTGYPKRTVERWVYLARKRGFLTPTRPGEAR